MMIVCWVPSERVKRQPSFSSEDTCLMPQNPKYAYPEQFLNRNMWLTKYESKVLARNFN